MTPKIRKFIIKKPFEFINPYIIFIILIVGIISYLNYEPGTWLLGWDNHPIEMNWKLYLDKALTSVWQGWSGQGMVGGMSYAADLPRVVLLAPLIVILPAEVIRYIYTFFCLGFGALGVFKFTKDIVFIKIDKKGIKNLSSFAASLFYIFNLGTLQLFYATLEMFITAYAFIPWLLWAIIKYLKDPKLRNLLIVALLSFFATPMAITPALFINYALVVGIIILTTLIQAIKSNDRWKFINILKLSGILVATNLFWVLPSYYALFSKPNVVTESRTGTLASEDIRDYAQSFANWEDFPVLKSFWFSQNDMVYEETLENRWEPMMGVWINHTSSLIIYLLGIFLFILVLSGIFIAIANKKKYQYTYILIVSFLLGSFMLLGESPPLGFLFEFIKENSLFLKEVFRLPFSKFVYITIFAFGGLFGITINYILLKLEKLKIYEETILAQFVTSLILSLIFVLYMFPVFTGNFIFPELRIKIPNEYFQVFNYFQNQDKNLRILHLPANTWAGWQYYKWGYRGSGFLWYGIEQPIIDRAFDVWSKENEAVYIETINALYSNDSDLFKTVLEKYNISFLLIDKNIIEINREEEDLITLEIENTINEVANLSLDAQFQGIQIYKYKSNTNNTFELSQNPTITDIDSAWNHSDQLYLYNGDYVNQPENTDQLTLYPFYSLEERSGVEFEIDNNYVYFKTILKKEGDYKITLPEITKYRDIKASVSGYYKDNILNLDLELEPLSIYLNNELIKQPNVKRNIKINSTTKPDILSINNHIIELKNLSESITYFGKTHLFINLKNTFEIYKFNNSRNYTEQLKRKDITVCGHGPRAGTEVKLIPHLSGFTLSSKMGNACVFDDVTDQLNRNSQYIGKIEYTFNKTDKNSRVFPEVCLRETNTFRCLNSITMPDQITNTSYFDYFKIPQAESARYFLDVFTRNIDTDSQNKAVQIKYDNITLNTYRFLNSSIFSLNELSNFEQNVKILAGDELKVRVDKDSPYYHKVDFNNPGNFPQIYSCSKDETDSIREYSLKHEGALAYEFKNLNSATCILFNFTDLPHNLSYLSVVRGKNLEGRQLRINLDDPNNKRYLSVIDTNWNDTSKDQFILINNMNTEELGYQLNIRNHSIYKKPSINIINNVEIIPIHANAIQNIKLENINLNYQILNIKPLDAVKNNLSTYSIYVDSINGIYDNYLHFNQSYDGGWELYKFRSQPTFIDHIAPFITGEKINEHYKLNNWANSWQIIDSGYYVVWYWPQVLQNIGLSILFFTFYYIYIFSVIKSLSLRNVKP